MPDYSLNSVYIEKNQFSKAKNTDTILPATPIITSCSSETLVANLNGGDETTPDNELIFKIYGDADNYATAIATTGNAINDANVSVAGGVVTIQNVDVTGQGNIKLTSIDAEGNESVQSVAFVINNAFLGAVEAYSLNDLGLANSSGNVVGVKETGSGTVQEFTIAELNDGTSLDAFCGINNGILEYLISQVDGVKKTQIESVDSNKPILFSNGYYFGFIRSRNTQNIRTLFNEEINLNNTTSMLIGGMISGTGVDFMVLTNGNDSNVFRIMPKIDNSNLFVNYYPGSGSPFLFNTNDVNLNYSAINVISAGFRTNEVIAKHNNKIIKTFAATPASTDLNFVDLDLMGKNGGDLDMDFYAYARWNTGLADADLQEKHNFAINKFGIKDITLINNPTIVTPDTRSITGITYDYDNDEIVICDFDTASGLQNTNQLKRYNTALDTLIGTIPMPNGGLQDIVYYNGLYYTVFGTNFKGYDSAGVLQDTKTLPVTLDGQNQSHYYNGSLWIVTINLTIAEINPDTMALIQEIDISNIQMAYDISFGEGLAVNDDYYVLSENRYLYVFDKNFVKVGQIKGAWHEGVAFDSQGNLYSTRNEGFHAGTVNGNKCFKYSIS